MRTRLAASSRASAAPVGNQRGLARQPMTLRDARRIAFADEELAPERSGVAAREAAASGAWSPRRVRDARHGEIPAHGSSFPPRPLAHSVPQRDTQCSPCHRTTADVDVEQETIPGSRHRAALA